MLNFFASLSLLIALIPSANAKSAEVKLIILSNQNASAYPEKFLPVHSIWYGNEHAKGFEKEIGSVSIQGTKYPIMEYAKVISLKNLQPVTSNDHWITQYVGGKYQSILVVDLLPTDATGLTSEGASPFLLDQTGKETPLSYIFIKEGTTYYLLTLD